MPSLSQRACAAARQVPPQPADRADTPTDVVPITSAADRDVDAVLAEVAVTIADLEHAPIAVRPAVTRRVRSTYRAFAAEFARRTPPAVHV